MCGHGIAGAIWSVGRKFALALCLFGGINSPAVADLMVTVDVKGDTAPIATDGSDLFSADGNISSAPGAFPYEAKFTYDLSEVNGSLFPTLAGATGLMDATFTALGHTYSISDPNGSLTLSSATGDNLYGQTVSDGTASLDVSAVPASASDNPIKTPALAQSFSFTGTPFSFSSTSGSLTRTIFTEGDTNILANINSVTYSAGTTCASILGSSISPMLGGNEDSKSGLPTKIRATFTPGSGLSLSQAATACGYSAFDWQQTIESYPDNFVFACTDFYCSGTPTKLTGSMPFKDPPPNGYPACNPNSAAYITGKPDCSNAFPFYYDPSNLASDCAETFQDSDFPFIVICTKHVETSSALLGLGPSDQLNFYDRPESPGLKDGDAVAFSTRLLGILPGFIPGTDCLTVKPATCVDLKLGFDWDDTFTGPLGGNMGGILFTDTSPLGNSGTGGITIVDVLGESGSTPAVTEPPSFGILAFGVVLAVSASYRRRKREEV